MGSRTGNSGIGIERLEQRRLLCGDLLAAAGGHASGGADGPAAVDAPVGAPGRNDAEGHVVAAFAQSNGGMRGGEVVWGETTIVDGARVATWAIVAKKGGNVIAAGATLPLSLAQNMPQRGSGPAGAVASLEFPAVVRDTTYFNHLEVHSQLNGHVSPPGSVNPHRNAVPHFDLHFYSIPEADVFAIPGRRPPLPAVPADRLPAGYTQPGPSEAQMGRHSGPLWALADPDPLSTVVIAGYLPDASRMHFLEPMVSRDVLLQGQDFALNVPMPRTFDHDTLYPTRSEVVFRGGAHHFIYSDFIDTNPATPSGAAGPAHVAAPGAAAGGVSREAVATRSLFADVNASEDDNDGSDEGGGGAAGLLS